jgi:DNA-3-methyladenine glycosylase I
MTTRCAWAGEDPLYRRYHDEEWGVVGHDDRALYEMLVLESFQAGLSWITILRKREAFRRAFEGFDPARVARFGAAEVGRLVDDAAIVRNRAKIEAAVHNAGAFLEVAREFGSFDAYRWRFVGGAPQMHRYRAAEPPPATSPESDAFAADLKRRRFRFLGSTTVYAYMQATGMVNDHVLECFRHAQLAS